MHSQPMRTVEHYEYKSLKLFSLEEDNYSTVSIL